MYLITFDGYEMKTHTEKDVREWFRENSVDVAFSWNHLRSDGGVESLCGRWAISKVDGRAITTVDYLENHAWMGGVLVHL